MKDSIRNPESLFIPAALQLVIASFFFWSEGVLIDIGLTISIDGITTLYLIAFVLILYFLLYRQCSKLLVNRPLSWTHVLTTLGTIAILYGKTKWFLKSQATSDAQASIIRQLVVNQLNPVRFFSITGLAFIAAQLLFLINLSLGLMKWRATK